MIKVEIHGLDEAIRRLEDLERRAAALDGEQILTMSELFPNEFMLLNTDFDSIEAMFRASGFAAATQAEFEAIDIDALDRFVTQRTKFCTWAEMKTAAGEHYTLKRLGLS